MNSNLAKAMQVRAQTLCSPTEFELWLLDLLTPVNESLADLSISDKNYSIEG
jgi:hypothetical protein